jgi:serine/threonine protein kinase
MGAVYEAVQEDLRRSVALKLMHANVALDQTLVDRFRVEAQAAAAIGHPNITQVFDFRAVPPEPPYIVMELLSGISLRDLIARSPALPPSRVAFIGAQVLSALGAAHARGIVHRDIKPANVFICSGSAVADLAKVLDFGVAKLSNQDGPESVQGSVVGTIDYMAPEQARGEQVDARADVYSVGVMLYHALAGKRPFSGSDMGSRLRAILFEPAAPLSSHRSDVPPALVRVIERALEKDPARRFASAEEMQAALMQHVPGASPPSTLASRAPSIQAAPETLIEAPPTIREPDTASSVGTQGPPAWMVQTMISPANAPLATLAPVPAPTPHMHSQPMMAPQPTMAPQPMIATRSQSAVPVAILIVLGLVAIFFVIAVPLSWWMYRSAVARQPESVQVSIEDNAPHMTDLRVIPTSVAVGDVDGDGAEDFVTTAMELSTQKYRLIAYRGRDFKPAWMSRPIEAEGASAVLFVRDVIVIRDFDYTSLYAPVFASYA